MAIANHGQINTWTMPTNWRRARPERIMCSAERCCEQLVSDCTQTFDCVCSSDFRITINRTRATMAIDERDDFSDIPVSQLTTLSLRLYMHVFKPAAAAAAAAAPCVPAWLARPFQICNKVFGNASALAKHKLTHSDERKYVCGMCSKAFKRQDHL